MEKDVVCQDEFDRKIWGAVSVIISRNKKKNRLVIEIKINCFYYV